MEVRKLPVGIQAFEGFRSDGYLYVDKTEYIYQLIGSGKVYFLSRPRRFGKSLLLSTIRAFWEGKKELFHGLAIEGLVKEDGWYAHPVFAFDFNGYSYQNKGDLETALDNQLKRWEHVYMPTGNLPPEDYSKGNLSVESRLAENLPSLSVRFRNLLEAASEHTGRRCVVLVDEYDKSLLETIDQPELCEHNRMVFKSFFSVLKSCDEFLRFVFITGVTKFSKVSIFSDLNQLNDISLNETFSAICGITEREIREYFQPETEALAARQHMTAEECMQALRDRYDGYRFCSGAEGVYNPFSILKAFYEKDFGSYWFETGTPTFLVKLIRKNGADVRKISNGTLYATRAGLTDYRADSIDLVPLLYQAGYLTIADYDRKRQRYTLCFPNEEVEYGFLESLAGEYVPALETRGIGGTDIFTLEEYVENGDLEGIRYVLTALFAGIPYTEERNPFEHYFQTVIYLVFTLLGQYVRCEMHTFNGRVDCVLESEKYIYLFEFKRDDTAENALAQIKDMGYALPFAADRRKLYRIGVGFDSSTRMLTDWKAEEGKA